MGRDSRSDPLVLSSRADTSRDRFEFHTRAGVHSHDEFRGGDLLALEHLWGRELGRLLSVQAGYGVVGIVLAESAETVRLTETSARAAALCERNVRTNAVEASVDLVTDLSAVEGAFDTAVYVPRPYTPIAVARDRIAAALDALEAGGELFVAAKRETGLSRFEDALDGIAVDAGAVASHDDWTLLRGTSPETFDRPKYVEERRPSATVDGVDLTLVTRPGLFSATELDAGTRLLAETAEFADGERVLDVCCGYGPLGTYAGLTADCEVWLSDDDRVATACAERTLDANDVEGTVVTGDGVEAVRGETFDTVVCNPPTHAGRDVLSELFEGIASVLASDGSLWLVHHRDLDLEPVLVPFETVERVATGDEHVILRAAPR